jgi:hypothetical protein
MASHISSCPQETCAPTVKCFSHRQLNSCCPSASCPTALYTPQAGQVRHIDWQTDSWGQKVAPGHASRVCQFNYYEPKSILLQVYSWTPWTDPTDTLTVPAYNWMTLTWLTAAHSMNKTSAQQRLADTTHCTTQASHCHHRSTVLPLIWASASIFSGCGGNKSVGCYIKSKK